MHRWLGGDRVGDAFEGRRYTFINGANLLGAAGHGVLVGVFLTVGLPELALASGLVSLAMALGLLAAPRGWQQPAFHSITALVLAEGIYATIFLGLGAGFHLLLLVALILLVLLSALRLRDRMVLALGIGLLLPALIGWMQGRPPLHPLQPEVLDQLYLVNFTAFAAMVLVAAGHYTWTAQGTREAHRQAQRDLRRADRYSTATLRHMADGLFTQDTRGRVLTMNPAMAMMLSARHSLSNHDPDAIPASLRQLAKQAMAEGEVVRLELEIPGNRIAAAVASPLLDAERTCEGAVVLVRDITVDKQVDRMKTELTSMVSHELRTPMTSVLGFAKIVRSRLEKRILPRVEPGDPKVDRAVDQVRTNLDIITAEATRLTDLISDVLDIAKMEAGHLKWQFEPLTARALVDRAVAACSGLFAGSPVALRAELADDLPLLSGDRDRLHQVLVNLVSNAHKFTEEGEVVVRAEPVDGGLRFSVQDTGPGIPPDMLETVFDKFQQLGEVDTNKPRGTGLGLAICRQIVASHGGTIRVDSTLGEGSMFSFELPAEPN